jgi:hypothetical protein
MAMMEQGSFKYKTENYYGSQHKIHTVSWKGKGEVDSDEVRNWCTRHFGPAGYQDELEGTRWLDDIQEQGEIFLCRDEDLTFFLLKWT